GLCVVKGDGILLAGSGAFGASKQAMDQLSVLRWVGQRVAGGRPVLGVCVGHQVLFERSVEFGIHEAMGESPGSVEVLPASTVPHVGRRTVQPAEPSLIFAGLTGQRFDSSHSYALLDSAFVEANQSVYALQVSWAETAVD